MSLLAVEQLSIDIGGRTVIDDVSFALAPATLTALVGESGSGKTMIGRSLLRLLPAAARVTRGRLLFEGSDLLTLDADALRRVRGSGIGMVFQDPMASLNPAMTVGAQLTEGLRVHDGLGRAAARNRAAAMLDRVAIADPHAAMRRYPHEFSGGMRQRIMLAAVLGLRPRLLVADEPTTALDAVIAEEVMALMLDLAREAGSAVLLISHDLRLVARNANDIVVLQRGRVVEAGPARAVLATPGDPYTRALVAALPTRGKAGSVPAEPPLVEVDRLTLSYHQRGVAVRAVDDVSIRIARSETLALVGESGSGKSSVGRTLLRLVPFDGGTLRFDDEDIGALTGASLARFRRRTAMVFQDPFASLDPRMRVRDIVAEPLRLLGLTPAIRSERVADALVDVALPDHGGRFPHELSGGQRQRVAIARAIVTRPDFIVADEPVSALDPTIQAQVLALFAELKSRLGFAMLFITHDLAVVEALADRVVVLRHGRVVEEGTVAGVFDTPQEEYTRRLLAAAHAGPTA